MEEEFYLSTRKLVHFFGKQYFVENVCQFLTSSAIIPRSSDYSGGRVNGLGNIQGLR